MHPAIYRRFRLSPRQLIMRIILDNVVRVNAISCRLESFVDAVVKERSQGFSTVIARLLRIQRALRQVLLVHRNGRQTGLFDRALESNGYALVALDAHSSLAIESLSSPVTDHWIARLLQISPSPARVLAHGIAPMLHDLGSANGARRLACRLVEANTLGPPSPVQGLLPSELLQPPLSTAEQSAAADELQQVVRLQERLCAEAHLHFIAL